MQKGLKGFDYVREEISYLRRGIDLQREFYKRANLENNFVVMVKAIENIKTEIKHKAIARNKKNSLIKIQKILNWYYKLPQKYSRRTPLGYDVIYPINIEQKISNNLQVAYETLIDILTSLELI